MQQIDIHAVFLRMLLAGAQSQHIEIEPILMRHGISRLSLEQSDYRIPAERFANTSLELMQTMQDEFLGLTEKRQALGSFNMMARACINTKTIRHSLIRGANFWNLFENTFRHEVLISGGRVYYQIHLLPHHKLLNNYAVESIMSAIHRFHCWLGGQFIPLTAVGFAQSKPDYSESYKPMFYSAPIRYDQPYAWLQFEARYANLDIVQTDATLDQYLQGQSLSLLNQPKQTRALEDQIKRWLEQSLRQTQAVASQEQTAQHFGLSTQVLHRRLQTQDTSFKELKMQVKRDLAIKLLLGERHKVETIASRVGFSEPSAFIRAFKAWTGLTPLQYRHQYS